MYIAIILIVPPHSIQIFLWCSKTWASNNCFAGTPSRKNDYFAIDTVIDNKKFVANSCVTLEPSESLSSILPFIKLAFIPAFLFSICLGIKSLKCVP